MERVQILVQLDVLKYVQSWIELQDPFSVEREDPCGDFCPNPLCLVHAVYHQITKPRPGTFEHDMGHVLLTNILSSED